MFGVLKQIAQDFNRDQVPQLASSIAFAAIFSVAPLVIVVVALVGWFLRANTGGHGQDVAESALLDQIARMAGSQTADTVRQLVAAAFGKPRQSIIAQIVGWCAFVAGAAGLFGALQGSLNQIWRVDAPAGGWKMVVRARLASFVMILVIVALLLCTFAANATIGFASGRIAAGFGSAVAPWAVAAANQVVTLAVATLGLAAIYKILPDRRIAWRDVWVGAFLTAILFAIGEVAIAFYLVKAGVASAYGAAGSLLATLLWIYYSAIVLLLGAECTKAMTKARG